MLGGYFILPHPVYRRSVRSSCRYFWSISACIFVHLALNCTNTTLWNTKIIFQQFTTVQWCQKSGWYLQGEAGELPPHWIWPSLPLVCLKTYRGNGKGEGKERGNGRVGETTCRTPPPHWLLPQIPPCQKCHFMHSWVVKQACSDKPCHSNCSKWPPCARIQPSSLLRYWWVCFVYYRVAQLKWSHLHFAGNIWMHR